MLVIETSRLLLRKPEPSDLEPLFQIHADPATNRYNPTGPVRNREVFQQELNRWIKHHDQYGFGYYVIIDKSDAGYVGACGLKHVTIQGEPYLNLYYRITPEKMRRGYVKEAARTIIDTVLRPASSDNISEPEYPLLQSHTIVALTLNTNIPSIRTAMTLGLKHDPALDDYDGNGNVYYFSEDYFEQGRYLINNN